MLSETVTQKTRKDASAIPARHFSVVPALRLYLAESLEGIEELTADADQKTIIEQHPPTHLLPVKWKLKDDHIAISLPDYSTFSNLAHLDPLNSCSEQLGLKRLEQLVLALLDLTEHWLSPQPLLLHPAIISFDFRLCYLLSLPFSAHNFARAELDHPPMLASISSCYSCGTIFIESAPDLFAWFVRQYHFSASTAQALAPLWHSARFNSLYETLQKNCKQQRYTSPYTQTSPSAANSPLLQTQQALLFPDNYPAAPGIAASAKTFTVQQQPQPSTTSPPLQELTQNLSETLSPPGQQTQVTAPKSTPGQRNDNKPGNKIISWLKQRLPPANEHNFSLFAKAEKTLEVKGEDVFFRMAVLSEGMPGTPHEQLGQRSYILVDEFYIGRDAERSDFFIDSPTISRQHAIIRRRAGSFFLEDLESTNGTRIDGRKLPKKKEQLLPDKCRISFGDTVFYFQAAN